MAQPLESMSDHELAAAIRAFDARYGEMEKVLWCLATHSREALLNGLGEAPALGMLVWKIKSWWGVQGVRRETQPAMVNALSAMDWSSDLFQPLAAPVPWSEEYAVELVATFVRESMALGAQRREGVLARFEGASLVDALADSRL